MRRLSVLLLALAVAGCGTAVETGVPASSGQESVPVAPTAEEMGVDESKATPPLLVLVNAAGKQIAAHGSSCVQYTDPSTGEGVGVCGDTPTIHPDALTVAHPGEFVMILLAGAFVTDGGLVTVRPLGCSDKESVTFPLVQGASVTHWHVDLEPGAYELDVSAQFGSNDGRTGDVTGSLGLLVDADRTHEILPVPATFAVCPFS
jgi:hypothetical protein